MIVLDGSQIRTVTTQGITYIDDAGAEQFIDFAQCFENYSNPRLTLEAWERHKELNPTIYMEWDEYIAFINKYKEVGGRDFSGPFVQFHTKPPIRFNFATMDEFYYICYRIRKVGWKTFDWA